MLRDVVRGYEIRLDFLAAVGETGDQAANQQGDDQGATAMADQGQGDAGHR